MKSQWRSRVAAQFPFLLPAWRRVKILASRGRSAEKVFSEIHRANAWGDQESLSGQGSNQFQTRVIREVLPNLMNEFGFRSIADIPCGDFNWMKTIALDADYVGGDIVPDLVEQVRRNYGNERRQFIRIDLIRDIPPAVDLLLCRDCLVHLSNADIMRTLTNIRASGTKFLLTTTFPDRKRNEDIPTGSWRPINLECPPFQLPSPIRVVNEQHPDATYRDKSVALWSTADIPVYASMRYNATEL